MIPASQRRAKRAATAIFAAVIMIAPVGSAWAAAAKCASSEESAAFRMRHLQSRLMVAALGCNQQAAYNTFVERFREPLVSAGGLITDYYKRTGGGQTELNKHITELANAAGLSRAEDPNGYCTLAWNLFWHLEQDPQTLTKIADDNLLAMAQPQSCTLSVTAQTAEAAAEKATAAFGAKAAAQ
jgi:hypothetical protein